MSDLRLVFYTIHSSTDGNNEFGYHEFNKQGGTIRSDSSDTWSIGNKSSFVAPNHANVGFSQDSYFIEKVNASIFINDSESSIGASKKAELVHGATVRFGAITCKVIITTDPATLNILVKKFSGSLSSILDDDSNQDNLLLPTKNDDFSAHHNPHSYTDIMEYQPLSKKPQDIVDPLVALDNVSGNASHVTPVKITPNSNMGGLSQTFGSQQSSGMDTSFNDAPLGVASIEDLENEVHRLSSKNNENGSSATPSPINTFHQSKTNLTPDESRAFLVETIKGLKSIYHSNETFSIKKKMSSIPFQLIEDNPILLENSTEETLDMLFSGHSNEVYLSGSSAVKECFDQIKNDHRASDHAVEEALEELMLALSPEVLMKRFMRYSNNKGAYASDEEWAWVMFKKYYTELMTDKQSGFYRLFKELYTQSYDKKIRSLQLAGED